MNTPNPIPMRDPSNDRDWSDLAANWKLRSDTIYLNHGSFGLQPNLVRYNRRSWIDRLDEQPMDFYLRQMESALFEARTSIAEFIGTNPANLVLIDNATYAMNIVANSFSLNPGDEVLINDHEYGAVHRIWQRACDRSGAKLVSATLPDSFESKDQIVDCLIQAATNKTRLVVVSHITSATALIMPIEEICNAFHAQGVAVCVDGPHAPAHVELSVENLKCDFYTASLHKWLCAPLGSGFLYVHPRFQNTIQPPVKSWGRLLPAIPETWDEEFTWIGSRDPSPFLSVPQAIGWIQDIGLNNFRNRACWLASYTENCLRDLFHSQPIGDRSAGWYGAMTHVPLPPGDWSGLQKQLWEQIGIEVMIILFKERWYVRVSHHLYNNQVQINTFIKAISRMTT
ncbi:aminotransferase class V-fold PLP-dependent enzyme [Mariniblastus sp.]|nr:aminotransferase class V-fold PLP-dependent enzyme [Mariniblastus sp.]MDA7906600.1 aminotransferase class V-fold PLP-dependent enzyme [Mariniblastus sp.]